MKFLLSAALLLCTVSADTPECKFGSCGYGNGPSFSTGDSFGDLDKLRAAKTATGKDPKESCGCTAKYTAAPTGWTAAYTVICAGRLDDQTNPIYVAAGMNFNGEMQGLNTVADCVERCNQVVGCAGFNFNFYDAEMKCTAIGANPYCKGDVIKGNENKNYPEGPGKDKGLLTSRDGIAVYMKDAMFLDVPEEWSKAIPDNLKAAGYKTLISYQLEGKVLSFEDICIAGTAPMDVQAKEACNKAGEAGGSSSGSSSSSSAQPEFNTGSTATASVLVLAVAAAQALKLY